MALLASDMERIKVFYDPCQALGSLSHERPDVCGCRELYQGQRVHWAGLIQWPRGKCGRGVFGCSGRDLSG